MERTPHYTLPENGSLLLAIIVLGIMAGFFWTYTFNVNYAMLEVDGATYARVQSLFNVNVRHFMFFIFFFGGGFFSVLALLINYKHWQGHDFHLLLAASLIYLFGIIAFTHQVNLPLNYYTESWDPLNLPADWERIRAQWNQANTIRVVTSFSAFLMAALALLLRASK
ncbi:MAG: DUF1772 domain-containing protein [Thiolinea sp.]